MAKPKVVAGASPPIRKQRRGPVGTLEDKAEAISVKLPKEVIDRIDAWQIAAGLESFAAAVRQLMQSGLDSKPGSHEFGKLPKISGGIARTHHFSPEQVAAVGVLIARLGGLVTRHKAIVAAILIGLEIAEAKQQQQK